jgi:hypothetical protein
MESTKRNLSILSEIRQKRTKLEKELDEVKKHEALSLRIKFEEMKNKYDRIQDIQERDNSEHELQTFLENEKKFKTIYHEKIEHFIDKMNKHKYVFDYKYDCDAFGNYVWVYKFDYLEDAYYFEFIAHENVHDMFDFQDIAEDLSPTYEEKEAAELLGIDFSPKLRRIIVNEPDDDLE